MKFQLVLPCYNESKSIMNLVERAKIAAQSYGFDENSFQLVLVENGSKDNSLHVMTELKKNPTLGSWFQIVPVTNNQGYGFGIWNGLQATSADIIAWSHADQQCDPADAFRAYKVLNEKNEYHLIKGVRHGRSAKERFVSFVFAIFARVILGLKYDEINAQPKVFHRKLLGHLTNPPKDFSFDLYVLYTALRNNYKIETIDVEFPPRIHGLSNWAFSLKNRWKTIKGMIQYMSYLSKTEGRL